MLFIFHVGKGKFLRSFISFLRSFISFFRSFISRLRGEFSFSTWRLANFLVEDGGSGVSGELLLWGAFRIFGGRGLLPQEARACILTNRD